MENVEIRELEPALLEDYLTFFDQVAFADNPWWSHCYCTFYHRDYADVWPIPPELKRQNREFKAELIRSGQAPGFLAFADGRAIGWCNAGPRAQYQNLRHIDAAIENRDEAVGSILCFVIAADHRSQGVATALLAAACAKFRRDGLAIAEGYPSVEFPASQVPMSARNYHGPLEMYLKAGFEIHRRIEHWAVVRKSLT
jgi:GNAT superfamily N-acetyltransferase